MSVTTSQEHSYLKVLFDFQYRTKEGREIIIKKNERLYLLQKTNADWWQVVRNLEQRSFYVPTTYVREISKNSASSTRKNSEEDRETIFEPPEYPSYKSMPKESSNAMRDVKKWLAEAIDSKPESPRELYDSDVFQKSDATESGSKSRLKVGLVDAKIRSLERDRRSGHYSDREEDTTNKSPRSSGEYHDNRSKITNRFSMSPRSPGAQSKIEASLQDPFRRELESSLDRRNLCGKLSGGRVRTRSMNSEGNQIDGEATETRDTSDKNFMDNWHEKRGNSSIQEESCPRDGRAGTSDTSKDISRSMESEAKKLSIRREVSPRPVYERNMTIAADGCDVYHERKNNDISSCDATTSGTSDHRILSDKRRTWAVEELMSELTQMCKERVTSKKPAFQLKSTEIKANFDPIEKLTQEIHEMNRMRSEANTSESINEEASSRSKNHSPINVCKISINSDDSSVMTNEDTEILRKISENDTASDSSRLHDDSRKSTNSTQSVIEPVLESSPKTLKSPKSPKILDEYNEANILSDCNSSKVKLRSSKPSLSPDKQSFSRKNSSPARVINHTSVEVPCYSNVKINADRTKLRPKLRIKSMETRMEMRLTPSLEKLAGEIQFLPATRTSRTIENSSPSSGFWAPDEDRNFHENYVKSCESNDSLKHRDYRESSRDVRRLAYKGSFKTKREVKHSREREKLRTRDDDNHFEPIDENSMTYKRRSRSLSDLEALEMKILSRDAVKHVDTTRFAGYRPIPLPRTKIPAPKPRESSATGFAAMAIATSLEDERTSSRRNIVDCVSARTIPEQRKSNRERTDDEREENSWQIGRYDLPSSLSLDDKSRGVTTNVACRRNVKIESSTAVGFKSLLCASDSGSDNCLQSKELLSSSADNLNEGSGGGSVRKPRKSCSSVNFNERFKSNVECLSNDRILSSNASSEALHTESELSPASQPSPTDAGASNDSFECAIDLPPGWLQKYDTDIEQIYFINEQGDKWFSSNDAEGKIYFFEENSNESSWVLPTVETKKSHSIDADEKNEKIERERTTNERIDTESIRGSVLVNRELSAIKPAPTGGDWPHLCEENKMLVLKEGIINRTKITENGKKLRKNWNTSYAVLTELFLLFFKDAKTYTMTKTGQSAMAKPDISVDLNGALVEPGERASSRKNVYMISTILGLQVLVQSDNTGISNEWFQEIREAIRKLPSGFKSQGKLLSIVSMDIRKISSVKQPNETNLQEDTKKITKIARSRSIKLRRLDDSLEDLNSSAAERQTRIKDKLRRFFQKRPTVEFLMKNGIYKDEPAFGSYLSDVCSPESPRIPLFVKTCIEVLESNEENMKSDGLYRASGNLSQIQKIRLQVDQYKLDVLSQEEDVHVLTGALKLFFRELKESLIPPSLIKESINASMHPKTSTKIQRFRDIVKRLPTPNHDTLQYLLQHLLRVTSYQEFNRMHISNLAMIFGPTLMWHNEESANMALDLLKQNLVIECLLSEYNKIFK